MDQELKDLHGKYQELGDKIQQLRSEIRITTNNQHSVQRRAVKHLAKNNQFDLLKVDWATISRIRYQEEKHERLDQRSAAAKFSR